MEKNSRKIKVLEYSPHLVTYEACDSGEVRQVRRQRFDRKLNLGFYEVLNPQVLPKP